MIWVWIGGAVLLVVAAVLPMAMRRASTQRREYRRCRQAAQSAMSRLETAIDLAGSAGARNIGAGDEPAGTADSAADALAEAQRCATLAGAALAGPDTVGGFRQAEAWARKGLAALGDSAPSRGPASAPDRME